ncbi:MAG: CocE/NonD family hydrolase [Acidobacteriota bacterium]|nr:CocE/NonD family hydrolase [Acidobacteriota bacterium]
MSWMRGSLLASIPVVIISGLLSAQVIRNSPKPHEGLELLGSSVPMRDGVHLAADVFLPGTTARWPSILIRTPYNRKGPTSRGFRQFVPRGYALVLEDVRGTYASQGVFGEIKQEGPDGNDTINWIAEQPWSNGKVAMAGSSYPGIVQWWAALEDNPHLLAIAPICSGEDEYTDRFYSTGGAMKLGHRLLWLAENFTPPAQVRPLFSSYIGHLPLRTADVTAAGIKLPLWREALDHPSYDAYWKERSIREQVRRISVPVLSMGGWFDNYVESDLNMFAQLSASHKEVETWIGPWGHNPGLRFPTRDFGREAIIPIRGTQASWFDHWLRKQSPAALEPPNAALHIFVMGPDIWREEREWPLARTRYTPLYLDSGGHANTEGGDGALQWKPVRKAQADTFTYDPKDPVPTVGGAICCEPKVLPPGPLEQSAVERRPDVLVYTSAPLNEDLEVTGPVRAVLYAATSANDTDFTAKLVDVQPDGRALAVCDGIQRLRYRLSLEKPVFVKRNAAYQISVDAGVTSYVFFSGHRMRLEISSSNFPRFDRNLNSSAPNADIAKIVKAKQTLYHEKGYPSAIILPIIPKHSS